MLNSCIEALIAKIIYVMLNFASTYFTVCLETGSLS